MIGTFRSLPLILLAFSNLEAGGGGNEEEIVIGDLVQSSGLWSDVTMKPTLN